MVGLAAVLVFVSLALAGYGLAGISRKRAVAEEAVKERLRSATGWRDTPARSSLLKDQRLSTIGVLNRLLARLSFTARLRHMMQQAGMSNRVGELVLYIPLLALLAALCALLVTDDTLSAVVAGIVGAALPLFVVQRRRRQRMRLFSEQLPDALDLLRAALQAGHSFVAALSVVADEFPNPVAEEFRTVGEEIRLGLPLRDALYQLRDRVDDANVPMLIVGILVAQETGGNMAEVLDNVAYTIRERFKLLRDAQVMTAQGRLSGLVLSGLPLGVGLFMYFLNPKYFAPMVETPMGRYLLLYVVVSVILGHFAIQRIARIRV